MGDVVVGIEFVRQNQFAQIRSVGGDNLRRRPAARQ